MIPNIDFIKEMLKGIKSFIQNKLEEISNKVDEVETSINSKQNALTFDNTPIDGSTNPVTSEGIKSYVDNVHVQSDLSQTDESSKDYVKGVIRQESLPEGYPYKDGVTIEWDGNTEGREHVTAEGTDFYWVSPEVLTDEEIRSGTAFSDDGNSSEMAKYWNQFVLGGYVTEDATFTSTVCVVRKANAEVAGAVFSTPGVYFMRLELGGNVGFISKFSSETITTIAPEFLPESAIAQEVIISDTEPTDETAEIWINTSEEWNDNIPEQVQADLNQTDETAPDYVKGTVDHTRLPEGYPYKEVTVVNEPLNLTFGADWEENIDNPVTSNDGFFIKVSNLALTDEEIKDVTAVFTTTNGSEAAIHISEFWDTCVSNGLIKDDGCFIEPDGIPLVFVRGVNGADFTEETGIAFPEAGIYLPDSHYGYYSSLTTTDPIERRTETIHPMAPEFLPAGVGGGGLTVTFTGANADELKSDTTFADAWNALNSGKSVAAVWDDGSIKRFMQLATYGSGDISGTAYNSIVFAVMLPSDGTLAGANIMWSYVLSTERESFMGAEVYIYYPS